ncbi:MAG: hypothetical protein KAH32_02610 [Chlamydiia bacterium]|nr:hypothetical protein [Chlamydiia bacterium]
MHKGRKSIENEIFNINQMSNIQHAYESMNYNETIFDAPDYLGDMKLQAREETKKIKILRTLKERLLDAKKRVLREDSFSFIDRGEFLCRLSEIDSNLRAEKTAVYGSVCKIIHTTCDSTLERIDNISKDEGKRTAKFLAVLAGFSESIYKNTEKHISDVKARIIICDEPLQSFQNTILSEIDKLVDATASQERTKLRKKIKNKIDIANASTLSSFKLSALQSVLREEKKFLTNNNQTNRFVKDCLLLKEACLKVKSKRMISKKEEESVRLIISTMDLWVCGHN